MNREAIHEWLQQSPFQPFELRLSNGVAYRVPHPEYAMLLETTLVVGFPDSDRFATCSLIHVNEIVPAETVDQNASTE